MVEPVYPWLTPYWQTLEHYLRQQRIPQAVLIAGRAGIGKRQLAECFAASLLCERLSDEWLACGHCHACVLRQASTHPDFIVLEPESGKGLGIDSVRGLLAKMALKPQFEGQRVILIDAADKLNPAAANAFLKGLEEPGERTTIILVTDKPARLPMTIRSRCQQIQITQLDQVQIQTWLAQHQVMQADALLALANGSPLRALDYHEKNYLALAGQVFDEWLSLRRGRGQVNVVKIAENWLKHPVEPAILLDWMCLWLVRLLKLFYGEGSDPALQEIKSQLELAQLCRYYQSVLEGRQLLLTQSNQQLLLEKLLIEWSQLGVKHG